MVYVTSSQVNLSLFRLGLSWPGRYPEEHFIEKPVKEAMARFRKNSTPSA